jgi:hypothetical protein
VIGVRLVPRIDRDADSAEAVIETVIWTSSTPHVPTYNAARAGVAFDLTQLLGPIEQVPARIDPLLATPNSLTDDAFRWLVDFVRDGLLEKGARNPNTSASWCPHAVPSGRPTLLFQFEERADAK